MQSHCRPAVQQLSQLHPFNPAVGDLPENVVAQFAVAKFSVLNKESDDDELVARMF